MCFLYQESGKMKPLFSVSNFHIASLGYNNIKNSNTDLDFQIFIIKTDFFFFPKCNKSIESKVIFHIETVEQSKLIHI